jgi:hypothetical protein
LHDNDIYFAMLVLLPAIHFFRDDGSVTVDVQHKNKDHWWLRLVNPCSPGIIFLFVLGLGKTKSLRAASTGSPRLWMDELERW